MSDTYEDALNNIVQAYCMSLGMEPAEPDPGSQTAEQMSLLKEAITKARKFDQLVEARKLAAPGEWVKSVHTDKFHKGPITRIRNKGNAHHICGMHKNEQLEANAAFITLAANLTREE